MTPFIYTLLALTLHCANRKELSPCTCKNQEPGKMIVSCEKVISFEQVFNTLRDKFHSDNQIELQVAYSSIEDLHSFRLQDLRMSINSLKLNHNNISRINESSFIGLGRVGQLYLSDNRLSEVPSAIFSHLPSLKTLDLGREENLQTIKEDDFQDLPNLETLSLSGNVIGTMEMNSLPKSLKRLHIGRNRLKSLNGTLRELTDLRWLFINLNNLQSLDEQFAPNGVYELIHASDNFIEKLPDEFKTFARLNVAFFQNNSLSSLDEAFSRAKKLNLLQLSHNQINRLSKNDFKEAYLLADLQLGHNLITNLNGSIRPLHSLTGLNLNNNKIKVFDLKEIQGLKELQTLDLSYNGIVSIIGCMENQINSDVYVTNLKLDHNELKYLDRALNGLNELIRLNLSFNQIRNIYPNDLIGLDNLEVLDISNNNLLTLEELSKTFLPSLHELRAQNNKLATLERDFYGLPTLCYANLANNEIRSLSSDLVSRTRCKLHGITDILKINLQENPILCYNEMPEIISSLEVNYTKIVGTTDCEKMQQTLMSLSLPSPVHSVELTLTASASASASATTRKPEPAVTGSYSFKDDFLIAPEIIEIIEMKALPSPDTEPETGGRDQDSYPAPVTSPAAAAAAAAPSVPATEPAPYRNPVVELPTLHQIVAPAALVTATVVVPANDIVFEPTETDLAAALDEKIDNFQSLALKTADDLDSVDGRRRRRRRRRR